MTLLIIGCLAFLCIYIHAYYEALVNKFNNLSEVVESIKAEKQARTFDDYA